jgi:hypothetical protein
MKFNGFDPKLPLSNLRTVSSPDIFVVSEKQAFLIWLLYICCFHVHTSK